MGIENRPYVGSWQLGSRKLVQHTPDALVFLNGDMTLPGCAKCNGRIEIQKFVTQISVDAGTDPSGAQCNVTLSVPTHHTDAFARDAQYVLRPGLEIHIYMRGYFPVEGLYSNLGAATGEAQFGDAVQATPKIKAAKKPPVSAAPGGPGGPTTPVIPKSTDPKTQFGTADSGAPWMKMGFSAWQDQFGSDFLSVARAQFHGDDAAQRSFVAIAQVYSYTVSNGFSVADNPNIFGLPGGAVPSSTKEAINQFAALFQSPKGHLMLVSGVNTAAAYADYAGGFNANRRPEADQTTNSQYVSLAVDDANSHPNAFTWLVNGDYGSSDPNAPKPSAHVMAALADMPEDLRNTLLAGGLKNIPIQDRPQVLNAVIDAFQGYPEPVFVPQAVTYEGFLPQEETPLIQSGAVDPATTGDQSIAHDLVDHIPPGTGVAPATGSSSTPPVEMTTSDKASKAQVDEAEASWGPSMLDDVGLANRDLDNLLAYPYYHTFHGVLTQASCSWSPGTQTWTLQCASMLHFWEYHRVSTNASIFGARPANAKLRSTLMGHNFTGQHPYEIIYYLHNDTAGAAAGVNWALSQKTNQTARSEITGESLFSLNLKYWEQRFATRQIKLRMHGASGELFNAAQAAFLGKNSSSVLTSLLKNRFKPGHPPEHGVLSTAIALGFRDHRKMEALLQSRRTQGDNPNTPGPKFELMMPEMIAFVKDLGTMGSVQLFESTYESKMDIAQKICQITGFEFYQDVDGDFVFKPPMYNMDTSSSRVYRLEDIDIISINFEEKEPQATYITTKGSHFKNTAGTGLDNEWGVQGQYIDYRLVAQFGWRPYDFDTAYLNDSRSMFFAAVNRLAIMNAPCKSGSVTIPMRPELRPGYPVYVAYLDCFYYCNSFAHSFTVGGQCTTTMQLIAKRAKFFAPGNPKQQGIDAIRMEHPSFPQRPLQVLDNAGMPRLAGFPNVVMALDPEQLDPLFFIVGREISMIQSKETLRGLLKMAVELKVLRPPTGAEPWYKMSVGENKDVRFYMAGETEAPTGGFPSNAVELYSAAQRYAKVQDNWDKKKDDILRAFEKVDKEVGDARAAFEASQKDPKKNNSKALKAKLKALQAKQTKQHQDNAAFKKDLDMDLTDKEGEGGVSALALLIKTTKAQYFQSADINDSYGDPNSSALILDMLSDKKAVMTNGHLPGSYRYYSASHPKVEQQGQRVLLKDTVKNKETRANPLLDPVWQNQSVEGFANSEEIVTPPGAIHPEARLVQMTPQWGIKVLTNNPLFPGGEVVPTSEIRELMFAAHNITAPSKKGSSKKEVVIQSLGPAFAKAVADAAVAEATKVPDLSLSMDDLLQGWLDQYNSMLDRASVEAAEGAKKYVTSVPDFGHVTSPGVVAILGGSFRTNLPFSNYKFSDNPNGEVDAFPGSGNVSVNQARKEAAIHYARAIEEQTRNLKNLWVAAMLASNVSRKVAQKATTDFNHGMIGLYGLATRGQSKSKTMVPYPREEAVYGPVFPVSDAKGYEVIGSYAYGRGVDIEPGGVFDVLASQDPLSLLSPKVVEDLVAGIRDHKHVWADVPDPDKKGVTHRVRLDKDKGFADAERRAITEFRNKHQLTDKQILDIGIATGDPNMLQADMRNWIANKSKDGVFKIPLVNAGYSLADLAPPGNHGSCSCKAAEADVALNVAGQGAFVSVDSSGHARGLDGSDNADWTFAAREMSVDWRLSQDALRGASPDRQPSSLVQTVKNLSGQYDDWWEDLAQRKDAVTQAGRDIKASAKKAFED